MHYFGVFLLNMMATMTFLELLPGGLHEIFSQYSYIAALFLIIWIWGMPIIYWTNALWDRPLYSMSASLLNDIHKEWTDTIGFRGGRYLEKVLKGNNNAKKDRAKIRVLEIKKELLARDPENKGLQESIDFFERCYFPELRHSKWVMTRTKV